MPEDVGEDVGAHGEADGEDGLGCWWGGVLFVDIVHCIQNILPGVGTEELGRRELSSCQASIVYHCHLHSGVVQLLHSYFDRWVRALLREAIDQENKWRLSGRRRLRGRGRRLVQKHLPFIINEDIPSILEPKLLPFIV